MRLDCRDYSTPKGTYSDKRSPQVCGFEKSSEVNFVHECENLALCGLG